MQRPGPAIAHAVRRAHRGIGAVLTVAAFCVTAGVGRADPVFTWNQTLLDVIQQTSALLVNGPPEVAREMAIVDSAMFDAVNAASGLVYRSVAYAGPAVADASAEAAALAAGYTTMRAVFANSIWLGDQSNGNFGGSAALQASVLARIDATYTTSLAALGGCSGSGLVCSGISLGQTAGNAMLAASGYTIGDNTALATDGSATAIMNGLANNKPPGSGTVDGVYVPPANRPEMMPLWGAVTPVGALPNAALATIAAETVPGPPALGSAAYAAGLLETACTGAGAPLASLSSAVQSACAAANFTQETAAQAKAALFWNDPGTTYQPPGHWLDIAETVAQSQNLNLLEEARLTALISQAENDAGIGAWGVKYQDNLWRPVTAITSADCGSWNTGFTACDPAWASLIATPPHPDYVAGHPAFSGAAATVLKEFFGDDNIGFSSTSNSYCNGGGSATWRSTTEVAIVACTVGAASPFAYHGQPTIYSMNLGGTSDVAGCTEAGGSLGSSDGLTTCTLGGTTYVYNPATPGCNGIVSDGGSNDSPLICPITEYFSSFSTASSGPNGAEFSRIAGGIHTPFAVADALALGNAIGEALAAENGIAEPATLLLLAGAAAGFGVLRRRWTPASAARTVSAA